MRILLLGIALAVLTGCTGLADAIREAGKDNASVCVVVNSIYATVRIARTNIQNGSVSCTQEGMQVKSPQFVADLVAQGYTIEDPDNILGR